MESTHTSPPAFELRGYWSTVFHTAAELMRKRQGLNGETAYWLARDIVDRETGQPTLPLEETQ